MAPILTFYPGKAEASRRSDDGVEQDVIVVKPILNLGISTLYNAVAAGTVGPNKEFGAALKLEISKAQQQQSSSNFGSGKMRKVILLSRHGESENNSTGKIGGDTCLSARGRRYGEALASYVNSLDLEDELITWTSTLKRTISTAAGVKCAKRMALHELDELNAGICEGLSYEEIQLLYPVEFALRDQDKSTYRYPHGESYEDVQIRVQKIIEHIEGGQNDEDSTGSLLIVSHQAVLRCILSHFLGVNKADLPYIQVPLHTIIWLGRDPLANAWDVSFVRLPVECVDTFRPKPMNCNVDRSALDALESVPLHL